MTVTSRSDISEIWQDRDSGAAKRTPWSKDLLEKLTVAQLINYTLFI